MMQPFCGGLLDFLIMTGKSECLKLCSKALNASQEVTDAARLTT